MLKAFKRQLFRFARNTDGVAAIEFAVIVSFVSVSALNAADLAMYGRDRMEVENATEMGAQAAWKNCDNSNLPATTNCASLTSAVTAAIQSTSLGTHITLQSGYPAEAYYCVNSNGALVQVATLAAGKPSDCTAAGVATNTPGDYIQVQTTYSYSPLFPGITVANSIFGSTITKTAWMRLK